MVDSNEKVYLCTQNQFMTMGIGKEFFATFYDFPLEVSRKGYIFANGNKQSYCQTLPPHAYGIRKDTL